MDDKAEKSNWYEIKQNNRIGYALMFFSLKILPPVVLRFLSVPIGFFYWIFSFRARSFSNDFFGQLGLKGSSCKHIISFAINLVENLQSWAGKFSFRNVHWQDDDVTDLVQNINAGRGTVLVISHLGNAQMLKGLASLGESGTEKKMSITTISNVDISKGLYQVLSKINSGSSFHIVNSESIGPETVILLQERLEKGEVVVIAGDRVSANSDRTLRIPFLGKEASFPYGVFLLLALLNVPSYFLFGLRQKDISFGSQYDMFVRKNPVSFDCPRKEREARIFSAAKCYVGELENHCRAHPYQWYNFFDFWGER